MNEATKTIIAWYETNCGDDEASTIESIVKMNDGKDRAIVLENLKGWFYSKANSADKLVSEVFKDMLIMVDWGKALDELNLDIFGRGKK